MYGIGDDVGGAMRAFRNALKAAAGAGGSGQREMGLYDVAMAAGRPGLGGFAPVAGAAGRPVLQKSRAVAPVGEANAPVAGQGSVQSGAGALAARQGGSAETSYRAVVAQARQQAAAGRARREAEAAALYLPARGAGLAGVSFAPPAGGGPAGGGSLYSVKPGSAGGGSLYPAKPGSAGAVGLHRGNSVHEAVSVAEAASTHHGEAESQEFGTGAVQPLAGMASADIDRAVESYFFRQSRLPPTGGAGFNPLLSPVWAGLKIPG